MTDPIRILHFADVHIGMENFGGTDPETGVSHRVKDFLLRMGEMRDYAHENDADLIVFAGDAFKNATPNPTYQREFARQIRELAKLAPVIMLVGNHDLQPNANRASSIEIYATLDVPNVMVADHFEVFEVQTKRGRVVVGTAPYPVRARLMQNEALHGKTIKQVDEAMSEAVHDLLAALADDADALAGDAPRLLMGHFTVSGAMLGSERNVMMGRDLEIGIGTLADPRWDYVAMGHIHKHQNLTAGRLGVPPIVYSGSVERVDFGEQNDPKGFCWVELARHDTAWHFVPVNARPMVTITVDYREERQPTQAMQKLLRQHDLEDAIVRLRVELTQETDTLFHDDRIRETLRQMQVYHIAGIEHRVERLDRARLALAPEGMTHAQLLDAYLSSKGYDAPTRERLAELAQALMIVP